MSFLGWFKHKFNIGGVKLSIIQVEPITTDEGWVKGTLSISTKRPAFGQLQYKLLCETIKGSGQEKKTSTTTISEMTVLVGFALDENQSETQDFTFNYDLKDWFQKKGGVIGAAAKAVSFLKKAASESSVDNYYVQVSAKIPGVWADPTSKCPVTVKV